MSGITGIIAKGTEVNIALRKGCNAQIHRGLDNQSEYISRENNWHIGLAHQRLSTIDLAESGSQPMSYKDKGVIIFDGELYNHIEIRRELEEEGFEFQSDSDTEVLLVSLHHYGLELAINKFIGMWAFLWYDIENKKMYLCRDRFGIKPLQYFIKDNCLLFASEIKAILEMSDTKLELNEQKVGEYLSQSLIASDDETFFKCVYRLPAGSYAEVDLTTNTLEDINIQYYWNLDIKEQFVSSEEYLIAEVKDLFTEAVKLQLRGDASIGVLLSGGIDSSAITAVMHGVLGKEADINIFSAISDDKRFDESYFIDSVANYLGRQINKVTLDFGPDEAMDLLDTVNWHNDEPVGSFSNVAHFLLMKKAHEMGIKVILSGQGADELLCGYKKYVGFYVQQLVKQGKLVKAVKVLAGFKTRGTVLNQFSIQEAKRYLPRKLKPKEINILGKRIINNYKPVSIGLGDSHDVRDRQILDVTRYSVPMIAQYEDRMSMAWSQVIRLPFLDHRVVEKLISLPIDEKLNKGWTKYIFRKAIEPILPKEVVWRKDKLGFINPESEWLKNDLKEKVRNYFSEESLIVKLGLVDYESINKKYEQYCAQKPGQGNIWFKEIFAPLALESWLQQYHKYIK